MPNNEKTRERLQEEIDRLRSQIIELGVEQIKRKQAEDELWESERRFLRLLDELPLAVFVLDGQGKPYYQNRASRELLGKGIDPETNKRFAELYQAYLTGTDQVYPAERLPLLRALGGEASSVDDMEIRRRDKTVLVEFTASPIFDAQGKVKYAVAAFEDITERKQAEEELSAISIRQEAILHAVPDIIGEVDSSKVYTWANQTGLEFFGEDVIGKEAAFYFEGDQDTYGTVQPLFNGSEDVIYVESWQRRKDGKRRLLGWWCRVLKDASGKVTGALSSAQDITERKRIEEELGLRSEIITHIQEGVYLIRSSDGVIVYANPKFETLFGYGSGELLGKHVSIVNAPTGKSPEETARRIMAALKQDGVWSGEIKNRRKDGSDFWCSTTVSTFQHPKYGEVWLSIHQDITEHKQAEVELRDSVEKFQRLTEGTVQAMGLMVEMKAPYAAEHQRRVAALACAIAQEMGLSEDRIEGLRFAARIHDVGKIQIPAEILTRPGPLNENEVNMIRMHPKHSHDILKTIDFPWPVAEIVWQHHERLDGSGYPRGLAGDEILLEARILGAADAVASMTFTAPTGRDMESIKHWRKSPRIGEPATTFRS